MISKRQIKLPLVIAALAIGQAAHAAEFTPITSFDPNTFFDGGVTAGIDFNDNSPTEDGFLGIPASNNKAYKVTHNGITFDIAVTNAVTNENRDRNDNPPDHKGSLIRDFEQWYNNSGDEEPVEAAFTLTGLKADTDYDISFFTYNAGAGQTTHNFYEGSSSADPLITTFSTGGNWRNYSSWSPGITFRINSGSDSTIAVTVQSVGTRVTVDGVSVVSLVTPPPPPFNLVITPNGTGLYDFEWDSQGGKVYDLLTSTDLATPIESWPVYDPDGEGGDPPYGEISSAGDTTTLTAVPGTGARRFFAVLEKDAPPILSEDFEGGVIPADWTDDVVSGTGTAWEVGDPTGGFSTGPPAAASGSNCAGTNIAVAYTASVDVTLTSPEILIPAGSGALLEFQQFIDTDLTADFGSVRILDSGTNALIGTLEIVDIEGDGTDADWTPESLDLPAADVGGKGIKIEFRFVSDNVTEFGGFYIDDVVVTLN